MTPEAVEQFALASFAIVPDGKRENAPDAVVIPLPRKSDETKTGRARFSGDICTVHTLYADRTASADFPCAKFSHLPGKGKGVKQPSVGRILVQTAGELVKPLFLICLLLGGLFGLSHFYHGRGNLLRPKHSISSTNSRLPTSSEHRTPSPSASSNVVSCSRIVGHTCFLSDGKGLNK